MRELKKCTITKECDDWADGNEFKYIVETKDGYVFDDGSHLQFADSYQEALQIAREEIIKEK